MDQNRLPNHIYMEAPKEYNIEIVHKDNVVQAAEYNMGNYSTLFDKHITLNSEPILDQKHSNLYLTERNIREIIIPESAIRIGQIICHEQTYENVDTKPQQQQQIITKEFFNRNDIPSSGDETKTFTFINKQNNIEFVPTNSSTTHDNKLFTRDYNLIESHYVTVDNRQQQLLQPNVYSSIQPVTHFQQQKSLMDDSTLVYQTKQLSVDYSQGQTNEVMFETKQLTNDNIEEITFEEKKISSGYTNYENGTNLNMEVSTLNYETNYNKTLSDDNYTTSAKQETVDAKPVKKASKEYLCVLCGVTFNKLTLLNRHKKESHPRNFKSKNVAKCEKTFSCNECTFVTKYSSALKRHKEVHTSNRKFECQTCGKVYNQLFNLKTHQRIHSGQKVYQCEECDFITPYHYSLKRHKIFHTGEKAFTCFVCDKKFSAAPDLKRHLRSHTGQKPYLCNLCGRLFRQTGHLKFHRSKHHPEYVEDKNKSKPIIKIRVNLQNPLCSNNINDSNVIEIKPINSPLNLSHILEKSKINLIPISTMEDSKLEFKKSPQIESNVDTNKLAVKNECINQIVTYIRPYKTVESKKNFRCETCDESFKSSRDLTVHNKIHQGEKSFQCETCNFVTLHPSSLRKHKRSHLLRKFPCSKCNASFTTEERLNIHMNTHDLNKKYSCDRCDFVSSYCSALNRHKLTHDVEKPFACDVCDEKFSQECHLNTHKRLHSGKKVYKCDECSFITPYHYSLKRHKISHTGIRPFPCTFCDAAFAGAEDLRRHVRAHLGEKPFICNICGRLFSQAAHVKNHKKKHFVNPEMKKVKKCLECGESFDNLSLLRQHKNSIHKQHKTAV